MAARRPRYLSPEEIVQLLQEISDNESDVEEDDVQIIDDHMDYKPPQNLKKDREERGR